MKKIITTAFSFRSTVMYLHTVQHVELPRQSYFDAKKYICLYNKNTDCLDEFQLIDMYYTGVFFQRKMDMGF